MNIWRLHIKPDAEESVDPFKFCMDQNILGVGWPVEANGPLQWDGYHKAGCEKYGQNNRKRWDQAVCTVHNKMKTDDICWTRDGNGNYYIGRIDGDWEYRSSDNYRRADIVNVRSCKWRRVGGTDSVLGQILNSFIPPSTVQVVKGETIGLYSQIEYNQLSGEAVYDVTRDGERDLFRLIWPEDCEDIVGIYLQEKHGYRLIPSSCRRDTVKTEFVLKKAGEKAHVQVKQGNVNLRMEDFEHDPGDPCEWFLWTTHGEYIGRGHDHLHTIDSEELRAFVMDNEHIMSDRVQTFIRFCRERRRPT